MFAILHGITLLVYVVMMLAEPSFVFAFLMLFGALRVATFGMGAVREVPHTLNRVYSGADGLWELGFFALLYSAYILVLDRGVVSGVFSKKTITQITRNVVRLLLVVAVVVGIRGWAYDVQSIDLFDSALEGYGRSSAQGGSDGFKRADSLHNKALAFQKATVHIFLVVTTLLAVHTVILLYRERARLERRSMNGESTDTGTAAPYAIYMPFLITIALLTRSVYRTVAINDSTIGRNKIAFYFLGALPEWLALLFFAVKGVVPKKKDEAPPGYQSLEDYHSEMKPGFVTG